MNEVSINVRREVIRCKKCKQSKQLMYLSDFSYGERLVVLNDTPYYAFENLIEDEYFREFEDMLKHILNSRSISYTKESFDKLVISTFGITCDKINGYNMDFLMKDNKCHICGSTEFENNILEQESIINIKVPVITHFEWSKLSTEEKEKLIIHKLKEKSLII